MKSTHKSNGIWAGCVCYKEQEWVVPKKRLVACGLCSIIKLIPDIMQIKSHF